MSERGGRGKRALVTGGGGFLGKALVRALLDRGWQVRSLARGRYPELEDWGVECIRGDLRGAQTVADAVAGVDCVFHTAALAAAWGPEQAFYQINVEGTANVIDACRKHHVRQLIYTSSPSVVFPMGDLKGVDESQPYPAEYTALYPQTKALAEQAVLKANDEQLATCALRPHLIWGPGDRHILPLIIQQVKAGKLPQIGEGDNLVDMCYIDNAVHAHLCAQERVWPGSEAAGKAYFISDGAPVNLWDWIRKFTSALGLPPIKKKVPLQAALLLSGFSEVFHRLIPFLGEPKLTRFVVANLAFSHYFKIDAARNLLGYTPLVDEPEGFRRSVEWFRAHGESAP